MFVFVDECHRTQSGKLHRVMKAMMPNAVFIGFTGTPLLAKDRATRTGRGYARAVEYLLFLYFADAPDVPVPCSSEEWKGAIRLTQKCLGLGAHQYRRRVGHVILSVNDMLSSSERY